MLRHDVEEAYGRFETRDEEVAKFIRRLRRFGAETWPRDLGIVELFCGRGSGLEAWRQSGFGQLEGVDASESLLRHYEGDARVYVGDCRRLEFADASRDVMCVQGGLHHLPALPQDLSAVIREVRRVLKPSGRSLVVESWSTPFLRMVHWLSERSVVRRSSAKFDAFAVMTEREHETYFNCMGGGGGTARTDVGLPGESGARAWSCDFFIARRWAGVGPARRSPRRRCARWADSGNATWSRTDGLSPVFG